MHAAHAPADRRPDASEPSRFGSGGSVLAASSADVGSGRERARQRRIGRLGLLLALPLAALWLPILAGDPAALADVPALLLGVDPFLLVVGVFFLVLLAVLLGTQVVAGRSPHLTFRPEQVPVSLDDVLGVDAVKEDVVRSLNLFLAHRSYAEATGGVPRRGLLFEGLPGTGKTLMAKAMAREAGVPFLFVSATSFQSMYYGATARKIRSYFTALRKAALAEGGAIGFIEEIDAIGARRSGMGMMAAPDGLAAVGHTCGGSQLLPALAPASSGARAASSGLPSGGGAVMPGGVVSAFTSEGTGGVVNELLVQMQSFDEPMGLQKLSTRLRQGVNLLLPASRQLRMPVPPRPNILLIAATNRADDLDPALLRPGRFDRRLTFDAPAKAGRRAILDHLLVRKAHEAELDDDEARDAIAAVTNGWTPVRIEHLLDEALVHALRRGATSMSRRDVEAARLVETVGLGSPVAYTEHERRLIATHEAGHATTAWLVAPHRRLEVLTIVKRRGALGLLSHGDAEDVFTRSRSEMLALVQVAMGGQVAERLFTGDVSTGPGGDLLYATNVAAEMVGSCGMEGTLVSFAAVQPGGLGGGNLVSRVLGDAQGREMVDRLLHEQRDVTTALLGENRHLVAALRDALLEREELVGAEITDVLRAARAAGPAHAAEASDDRVVDLVALEAARD